MKPLKWKEVNLHKIAVSKPEKNEKGEHVSRLFFINEEKCDDILVQTPGDLTFIPETSKISFSLRKKGEFYSLLENLKDRICEILHQNSKQFFKNKIFPKDHIYNAISDIVEITDEGFAQILNVTESSEKLKIYSYLNDEMTDEIENYTGSFIINIKELRIIKKSIKVYINVMACRLAPEKILVSVEQEESNVESAEPELQDENTDSLTVEISEDELDQIEDKESDKGSSDRDYEKVEEEKSEEKIEDNVSEEIPDFFV